MPATDETFKGFPAEAFEFLAGLSRNNDKTWFDRHRQVYDNDIVAPALRFVGSMGAALRTLAPTVMPEPRVGGSLFRIHRDIRFSREKGPYKTHVGIRFRDQDATESPKCAGPIFYVEFDAERLRLGVGVKDFDGRSLAAYRSAVARGRAAQRLGKMLSRAEAKGHDILGQKILRVPRGHADQPANDLLRRKGLFIREEMPVPRQIHAPEFVAYCRRWFAPYTPLFEELRAIVAAANQ